MYNIVCDSLGIKPIANNGTLRLPLIPIGLHSDLPPTDDDTPIDLPSDPTPTIPAAPDLVVSISSILSTPTGQSENDSNESGAEEGESLWDYLKVKLDAAKIWVVGVFSSTTTKTEDSTESN